MRNEMAFYSESSVLLSKVSSTVWYNEKYGYGSTGTPGGRTCVYFLVAFFREQILGAVHSAQHTK